MYRLPGAHHQGRALRSCNVASVLAFSLCFVFAAEDGISQLLPLILPGRTFSLDPKAPEKLFLLEVAFGHGVFLQQQEINRCRRDQERKEQSTSLWVHITDSFSLFPDRAHITPWMSSSWREELSEARSASWLFSRHLSFLFCTLERTTVTEKGKMEKEKEKGRKQTKLLNIWKLPMYGSVFEFPLQSHF